MFRWYYGIVVEWLKYGGDNGIESLLRVVNRFMEIGAVPKNRMAAYII